MASGVYDRSASTWRTIANLHVYDRSGTPLWRECVKGHVYDRSASLWREFYSDTNPSVDTAVARIGDDADGCTAGKCERCIEWTTTDGSNSTMHIRVLRSVNGGSYIEMADDLSIDGTCGGNVAGCSSGTLLDGQGCLTGTCYADGTSTQYKVRMEIDGGDTLVNANCELTSNSVSTCGAGA